MANQRLDGDGELEKQCTKCGDWWPADNEFFFTTGTRAKKKLHSWCKACYLEEKRAKYEKKNAKNERENTQNLTGSI